MLLPTAQKFPIQPIIDQIQSLAPSKRFDLNKPSGKFFNDPWINLFPNTPLGDVLNSLGNIGQARLLTLDSAESYTAHTDPDDRYHLAITTNPYCYLIDLSNSELYHLPVDGHVVLMDTSRTHVAANYGATPRIHLNIRLLLPHYNPSRPGVHFKVVDGGFGWKQDSYIDIMGLINRGIKTGIIYGFEAPNDRELFVNCDSPVIFNDVVSNIRDRGVTLEVSIK